MTPTKPDESSGLGAAFGAAFAAAIALGGAWAGISTPNDSMIDLSVPVYGLGGGLIGFVVAFALMRIADVRKSRGVAVTLFVLAAGAGFLAEALAESNGHRAPDASEPFAVAAVLLALVAPFAAAIVTSVSSGKADQPEPEKDLPREH
jgi:hypothetical protein